ncbi:MAG: hypothetical protein HQM14_05340 [SAR324 cluster bacterium]|nr:hypothetical protein [SAR324 cluster bacterium]
MWNNRFKKLLMCAVTTCFLIPSLSATEWKFQDYPGTVDIKNRFLMDFDYTKSQPNNEAPGKEVSVSRETFVTTGALESVITATREIKDGWQATGDLEIDFTTEDSFSFTKAYVELGKGTFYGRLGKENLADAYIFGEDTLLVHAFYGPGGYGASDVSSYGAALGYKSNETHFQFWIPYSNANGSNILGARPFIETKFGVINFVGAIESQTKRTQQEKKTKTAGQTIEESITVNKINGFGFSVYAEPQLAPNGSMIGIAYAAKDETTETQTSKLTDLHSVTYGLFGTFFLSGERWFGLGYHYATEDLESGSTHSSATTKTEQFGGKWFMAFHQTIGRGTAVKFAVSGTSTKVEPETVTDANPERTTEIIGSRMKWIYRF